MAGNGWTSTTLGNLIDAGEAFIQTGPFGSQLHSHDYRQEGVPVVPTEAIGHRRLKSEVVPLISPEKAAELARHRLQPGDILFARRGIQATGYSAILEKHHDGWLCGTGAILLRLRGGSVDPTYLSFHLANEPTIQWLKAHAVGAVMPNLNESVLQRLPLYLPEISEQREIAAILSSLDDKIELDRRMNETLESMARALFKSWFIDFDPVRAKAAGLEPTGVDPATAALFPAFFCASPLGEIPNGWRVAPIYDAADVIYGAPFASKYFNTNQYGKPIIRIRDLADENPKIWTPEIQPKGFAVRPGDIVVGMDGEFRAYIWGGVEAWLNQRVCIFAPKPGFSAAFVRGSIIKPLAAVEATETATTVIHIGKCDIDRFKVVIPDAALCDRFNDVAQSWYDAIVANKRQSRTVAAARDALLPKLLAGEVDLEY